MQSALNHPTAPSPVRVLHCIPTVRGGGAEAQLRLLAPRLAAGGIDVAIFARLSVQDRDDLGADGVACFPIRARGNHSPLMAVELHRAITTFRPTVIQTWLTQMDILAGAMALLRGIPWILSERASALAYGAGVKDRLRQLLGRRADLIVANSAPGLAYWSRARAGAVIGNGLDLATVHAAPVDALRDTDPFKGRFAVVSVSRLSTQKGLDVLIRAIGQVRAIVPTIRLIVVGDGPERANLRQLVVAEGLEDHVHFTGFQEAPLQWTRSADLFASMSRFEGQPNTVMEAAACGVPMVLSDIPEHRLLIGDAACYATVDDPASCAARLATLACSAEKRAAFGASGDRAARRFDIGASTDRYAALYRSLSAGRMAGEGPGVPSPVLPGTGFPKISGPHDIS